MANAMFTPAKEGLLSGEIDLDTATIKVALVRSYTFNSAHKFVSDVTGAGGVILATSGALTGKTVTGGVFDANDVTFTTPAASASNHYLLLFQSSAVGGGADVAAASQRVVAWFDTGANIPITTNGSDVIVQWDSGANRIIKL